MGFSKPKIPATTYSQTPSADLAAAQKAAAKAAQMPLPQIEPFRVSPPPTQTAGDIAAAERMARQQMGRKFGIQKTINPQAPAL